MRAGRAIAVFLFLLLAVPIACRSSANERESDNRGGCPDPINAQRRLLEGANRLRREASLSALIDDPALQRIASRRVVRMAAAGQLTHNAEGLSPAAGLRREGLVRSAVGENIARFPASTDSIEKLIELWRRGLQERRNLLDSQFLRAGFGVASLADGECYGLLLLSD